jgi:hypothetical protein
LAIGLESSQAEDREVEIIEVVTTRVADILQVRTSDLIVQRSLGRRLSSTWRQLEVEMKFVVDINHASSATMAMVSQDSGQAFLIDQIREELASRGLLTSRCSIQQISAPGLSASQHAHSAGGEGHRAPDNSRTGGMPGFVVVIMILSILVVLTAVTYLLRRWWSQGKRRKHRTIEGAGLKQQNASVHGEDSSDSDPGSPTHLHVAGVPVAGQKMRLVAWRMLQRLTSFSSSHSKHTRLKPDDQVCSGQTVLSPCAGAGLSQVAQSPLALRPTLAANCSQRSSVFNNNAEERPSSRETGDLKGEAGDGEGSTRPPSSRSQPTVASAMSALRSWVRDPDGDSASAALSPGGQDGVSCSSVPLPVCTPPKRIRPGESQEDRSEGGMPGNIPRLSPAAMLSALRDQSDLGQTRADVEGHAESVVAPDLAAASPLRRYVAELPQPPPNFPPPMRPPPQGRKT